MISAYFFISLVSHFSNRFDKNMFYMLAYGLHKMLKILIEIIVQIFHDIKFFSAFFVFFLLFFGLDGFWSILYRPIGLMLGFLTSEKNVGA